MNHWLLALANVLLGAAFMFILLRYVLPERKTTADKSTGTVSEAENDYNCGKRWFYELLNTVGRDKCQRDFHGHMTLAVWALSGTRVGRRSFLQDTCAAAASRGFLCIGNTVKESHVYDDHRPVEFELKPIEVSAVVMPSA